MGRRESRGFCEFREKLTLRRTEKKASRNGFRFNRLANLFQHNLPEPSAPICRKDEAEFAAKSARMVKKLMVRFPETGRHSSWASLLTLSCGLRP
jgi:hypothetical protein